MKFPLTYQTTNRDCGPSCLKMIAEYYDRHIDPDYLKKICPLKKSGVSMLDLYRASRKIGFHCRGVRLEIEKLKEIVLTGPVILHCNKNHFAVVYKTPKQGRKGNYLLADPAMGLITLNEIAFTTYWVGNYKTDVPKVKYQKKKIGQPRIGYAILLKPVPTLNIK